MCVCVCVCVCVCMCVCVCVSLSGLCTHGLGGFISSLTCALSSALLSLACTTHTHTQRNTLTQIHTHTHTRNLTPPLLSHLHKEVALHHAALCWKGLLPGVGHGTAGLTAVLVAGLFLNGYKRKRNREREREKRRERQRGKQGRER